MCTFALILFSLGMCACQKGESTDSPPATTSDTTGKEIPEVEVAEVKLWRPDIKQRFSGIVRPNKRALLSTRMSGTLTHLHVEAGEKVEAGELLAQVDARDIVAALDAAQAQQKAAQNAHAKAQLDVQRLERLYAEDLIARNRLELARVERDSRKAALEQAHTQVRLQQTNLEYARVSAPFAGVVSEVPIDQGSFVGPGTTLVVLEDRSSFRIDAPISAQAANTLRQGTPRFLIKTQSMSQSRIAKYQDIIPSMEKRGVGLILRLQVDADDDIRPGEVVEVTLESPQTLKSSGNTTSSSPTTAIPRSALIRQGQLTSVMIVEADQEESTHYKVHKRWIITASSNTQTQPAEVSEWLSRGREPGQNRLTISSRAAVQPGYAG
ncbi:MAG: efflux RND transporter periplasmic adaptor subunit [Geobacteraceae bacterium]|nr:efflux RND transporter periplasmic adaptor subunit [Geobacteraceae bacterium]